MDFSNLDNQSDLPIEDVERDINIILWTMNLYKIHRYSHQRFWESETLDAEYAARIEPFPRLESVAEHSWHVADTVLLLGGHFPSLNLDHCIKLAVIHDKMEILIGDKNPVGRNGTGSTTHAFNPQQQLQKNLSEREAIEMYIARLRHSAQSAQEEDLLEILEGLTEEARFVKAVDKLQSLAFIFLKKKGIFDDKHLAFTLKYSEKAIAYYPALKDHYQELQTRLLFQVAKQRNTTVTQIEAKFKAKQLDLF